MFNMTFEVKPTNKPKRTYWKCDDCLRAFTVEGDVRPEICSCGGHVHFMGVVFSNNTFGNVHERCACDSRCTHATGPSCGCSCGGVNHGAGVTVTVTTVEGKVKVTTDDAKHAAMATEWREAIAAATERYETTYAEDLEKMRRGVRIDYNRCIEINYKGKMLRKIREMKVHSTRMKKAREFMQNNPEIEATLF